MIKDLFQNEGNIKISLKPESWIEINLTKPRLMNGLGLVFNEVINGQVVKPKGLKIFAKEFMKDASKEAQKEEIKVEEPLPKTEEEKPQEADDT